MVCPLRIASSTTRSVARRLRDTALIAIQTIATTMMKGDIDTSMTVRSIFVTPVSGRVRTMLPV
jgi:hypothetical protein